MPKKVAVPETPIRILKIGTCPTLSGRSQLTYQVGGNTESEVCIRVTQNSGNGQFNADWVPLPVIEKLLAAHPTDKAITSRVLQPVYRGKSTNSPAFLLAGIKAEGLVVAGKEKDSGYMLGNIEGYKKEMAALVSNGTDLGSSGECTDVPDIPRQRKPKETK